MHADRCILVLMFIQKYTVMLVIHIHIYRDHVYGLNANLNTGNNIYTLPLAPAAYSGRGSAIQSRNDLKTISTGSIGVYVSGPVGIIHDLQTHTQVFYEGHIDDITCLDVSNDGEYAATGCVRSVGKVHGAQIHIWYTNLSPPLAGGTDGERGGRNEDGSNNNGQILVIGNGFFERAVCAVKFSPDAKYICGIGCDDNHRLGIWSLQNLPSPSPSYTTSNTTNTNSKAYAILVVEINSHHGSPDDLKWLTWGPSGQHTSYIAKEHTPYTCDVLCTSGDRQ